MQTNVTLTLRRGLSVARRFEFLAKDQGETLRFAPGNDGAGEKLDFDIKSNEFVRARVDFEF